MKLGIGGIEQNQSVLRKHTSIETCICIGKSFALAVALTQAVGGWRVVAKQVGNLCYKLICSLREPYFCNRSAFNAAGMGFEWNQLEVVRQQKGLVHFFKVVIFTRHPEDRYALHAGPLQLLCQSQGRGDLQECQQRSSKQSNLLAGNDRMSPVLQALDVA